MNKEPIKVNMEDLFSKDKNITTEMEKNIARTQRERADIFADGHISETKEREVLEDFFFEGNDSSSKILGLNNHKKISNEIKEQNIIAGIFNLARDMEEKSSRNSVKDKFYKNEEIQASNELQIAKAFFYSSLITLIITGVLFALFKSRFILFGSVISLAASTFTSTMFVSKKEKYGKFLVKRMAFIESDMKEIKNRLMALKDNVEYYQEVRNAEKVPNFTIEFSARINHIEDLINEYNTMGLDDIQKKKSYYDEILKVFALIVTYEKNTYDKYYHDQLKSK